MMKYKGAFCVMEDSVTETVVLHTKMKIFNLYTLSGFSTKYQLLFQFTEQLTCQKPVILQHA
jgi:hypothetical protein